MATASALEVELTPLDVLTELCCIASVCGLLGTERSSELSSLSAAEWKQKKKIRVLKISVESGPFRQFSLAGTDEPKTWLRRQLHRNQQVSIVLLSQRTG